MFIGHFALGLAAKRVAPALSLATLFVAAQLADLLWPFFLAAGLEQVQLTAVENPFLRPVFVSYPYSHSLLMLAIWGVLFGALWRARSHDVKALTVLFLLVVSHWLLDFVTHRPDMPLYPGSREFGLGLWNSPALTIAIELPLYVAGVAIYASATRSRDRIGTWAFWAFVLFLLVAYVGSLAGPPPPSLPALYGSAIVASALLLVWSWWADRHRSERRT
jgi:membrane-bound metal-dependent hydrolase YbcI (DUF457 family)